MKLLPPSQTAVKPSAHSSEYMGLLNVSPLKEDMPSIKDPNKDPADFHASDMRYLIEKAVDDVDAIELLEDFVGGNNVFSLLSNLGLNPGVNEISAAGAGGGAIAGAPGKKKKRTNTIIRQENIDLNIVDDVMRLIMEKGIAQ